MKTCNIPAAVQSLKDERPFFNAAEVPDAPVKYVAWFDLMGSASVMSRSLGVSATFLGKLHSAALRAHQLLPSPDDVLIYPIVDGVYITSPRQTPIFRMIRDLMRRMAIAFIFEQKPIYQFMVRCCVALGPVIEGPLLWTPSHHFLRDHPEYSRFILFGPPVAAAHSSEKLAAPFGVWIHESARVSSPDGSRPVSTTHWQWWRMDPNPVDTEVMETLKTHLVVFLDWCTNCTSWLLYSRDDILRHKERVTEYFDNVS